MFPEIETILREIGDTLIMPSYRKLTAHDVEEKSLGEIVTRVDRQAEQAIVARLNSLAPNIVALGEEGVALNPSLLEAFYRGEIDRCWLIDPLDGTGNFVTADGKFAIMVALIVKGSAAASWIYEPSAGQLAVCEKGAGAFIDGQRLAAAEPLPIKPLRGSILDRFLPPHARERVERNANKIERIPGSKCAGWDYPALAQSIQDFNFYWRLLPWDHAPGALFLTEAGGCVKYLDGSIYNASISMSGLIAATTESVWERARATLLGETSEQET